MYCKSAVHASMWQNFLWENYLTYSDVPFKISHGIKQVEITTHTTAKAELRSIFFIQAML